MENEQDEFLKSFGLYWRTWPEEKPKEFCPVLIREAGIEHFHMGYMNHKGRFYYDGDFSELEAGDQWMYTEPLEQLP